MKIFFLGDIVGKSGRLTVIKNLKDILEDRTIDDENIPLSKRGLVIP